MKLQKDIQDHIEFIRLIYRYGEAPFVGHFYQLALIVFADLGLLLIFVVLNSRYSTNVRILSGIGFSLSFLIITVGIAIPYIAGVLYYMRSKNSFKQ
jgi:hypothetical protein